MSLHKTSFLLFSYLFSFHHIDIAHFNTTSIILRINFEALLLPLILYKLTSIIKQGVKLHKKTIYF